MLILKLAYRNIVGAGIRTWLNVFVLSIAFVLIIWTQGLVNGMGKYAEIDSIAFEAGGGQFWHKSYDPRNLLTLEESHAAIPASLQKLADSGKAAPILITPGAIFPEGRIQTALIKGIDPDQKTVVLPSAQLNNTEEGVIPAMIGTRMARQTKLKVGDWVTVRWRDINGTFDATDMKIVTIMSTTLPTVDNGQIWIPLKNLREMMQAPNHATLVILDKNIKETPVATGWIHRDQDYLLKEIREFIKAKSLGSAILYVILMGMALLAIFDTQVLAIFRRRKEMGTLMALGMPRSKIISLFTLEGAMHGILALVLGAVYGIPIFILTAVKGISSLQASDSMGIGLPPTIYPSYGLGLVLGTTLLVFFTVTLVSVIPTRKIVKLKPTDALRGKMS